jgi:hypothetical protein
MRGKMSVWRRAECLCAARSYARQAAGLLVPGEKLHIWLENGLWHVGLRR